MQRALPREGKKLRLMTVMLSFVREQKAADLKVQQPRIRACSKKKNRSGTGSASAKKKTSDFKLILTKK